VTIPRPEYTDVVAVRAATRLYDDVYETLVAADLGEREAELARRMYARGRATLETLARTASSAQMSDASAQLLDAYLAGPPEKDAEARFAWLSSFPRLVEDIKRAEEHERATTLATFARGWSIDGDDDLTVYISSSPRSIQLKTAAMTFHQALSITFRELTHWPATRIVGEPLARVTEGHQREYAMWHGFDGWQGVRESSTSYDVEPAERPGDEKPRHREFAAA
jgi:hypothetical protein